MKPWVRSVSLVPLSVVDDSEIRPLVKFVTVDVDIPYVVNGKTN